MRERERERIRPVKGRGEKGEEGEGVKIIA